MPIGWQKIALNLLKRLGGLALTVVVIGGMQILLAILPWLAMFRSQPLGFSMALSLVGFGGWFFGFASTVGFRRTMPRRPTDRPPSAPEQPPTGAPKVSVPLVARLQEQIERSGCGTILFLSSLLPLALAFYLRLQVDMQTGKTFTDIFPIMP